MQSSEGAAIDKAEKQLLTLLEEGGATQDTLDRIFKRVDNDILLAEGRN